MTGSARQAPATPWMRRARDTGANPDRAEVLRVLSLTPGFTTPAIVYSTDAMATAVRGLSDAVSAAAGSRGTVAFSTKCNPRPEVLEQLARTGCGFVASWPRDVESVLRLGVAGNQIYWSGPVKRPDDVRALRGEGVTLIAESPTQLAMMLDNWGDPADGMAVGIRLHFTERSRFGIAVEELEPELRAVAASGIRAVGFQVHGLAGPWPAPAGHWADRGATARRACRLASRAGLDVAFVSLGGGLPEPDAPSRAAYAAAAQPYLAAATRALGTDVRQVVVEPGRFLVQWAGTLVATVTGVRRMRESIQVMVDVSFTVLASPTSTRVDPVFLDSRDRGPVADLTLVGPSDFHGDIIATAKGAVPRIGDLVALPRVGAYQEAFAARFSAPELEVVIV
jgi:diaminopimelate decarboxylase